MDMQNHPIFARLRERHQELVLLPNYEEGTPGGGSL